MPNHLKISSCLLIIIGGLAGVIGSVDAGVIAENHWNDLTQTGWRYDYNPLSIDGGTDTPDGPNALRFKFSSGMNAGIAPSTASFTFPNGPVQELWYQYWFKYDPNWTWQTIEDKLSFIDQLPSDPVYSGNNYVGVEEYGNGPHKIALVNQINEWYDDSCINGYCKTKNYYSNTGHDPTIEAGKWYRVRVHIKQNTPGKANGIGQVWINDQLVVSYSNIPFRAPNQANMGFGKFKYVPVWGGGNTGSGLPGDGPKPKDEYLWIDHTMISTDPITADYTSFSLTPKIPNPPSNISIQ